MDNGISRLTAGDSVRALGVAAFCDEYDTDMDDVLDSLSSSVARRSIFRC